MKYLKYFEINTYEKIEQSSNFTTNLSDPKNLDEFTQQDINRILLIWPNVSENPNRIYYMEGIRNNSFRLSINQSNGEPDKTEITISLVKKLNFGPQNSDRTLYPTAYTIYKLKDEWFILSDFIKSVHYKCDQIEGVVDCLKSII